ncbi:MAG: cytochrome c maturation protein CcmE [Pseudomonadota bacterium]
MKNRHKRFGLVAAALSLLVLATWLILSAFKDNLVFFYTPTQVAAGEAPQGRIFRLGGLVEAGSLRRDGDHLRFAVTDRVRRIEVAYTGMVPDLFKEGKGVVAQGRLDAQGVFGAAEVLAKHDENYMPPEAAYALEAAAKGAQ